MKSNVCILHGAEPDMQSVFDEINKVALYNGLKRKDTLQLMLLSEELIGIQKGILGFTKGNFYIENKDSVYKICLHADISTDVITQERFVDMSTQNRNEAARGIIGKIKYIANLMINGNTTVLPDYDIFNSQGNSYTYVDCMEYDRKWSLDEYRSSMPRGSAAWDEMERSIVANIADDIIVGATSSYIELTAIKTIQ
ncbi:MAG: hypothetical protein II273_04695 [Lachnospiraceae bacterium]|nr:hypothetical protein [Lachnospiraceae bacterium]MEE0918886.1 hypothetical protein [Lachnospiraceae bacterium]